MCLIQCLVLLVLKKGERTLLPFVSFPLSPSLLSTSPVADCISVVFSRTLWNYSLHPSPVHLTHVYFPQAVSPTLKSQLISIMQHKPAVYQVPEAVITYLVCLPCLDFSLLGASLTSFPALWVGIHLLLLALLQVMHGLLQERSQVFQADPGLTVGAQTLQNWWSQLGFFAPSHQSCPESH